MDGRLGALGWDAGWASSFEPHAAAGLEPGRVIAVHRETSVVSTGDAADRAASVAGRFRFEAVAPADYPAVGDWVALDRDVITAVVPRRTFIAGSIPSALSVRTRLPSWRETHLRSLAAIGL